MLNIMKIFIIPIQEESEFIKESFDKTRFRRTAHDALDKALAGLAKNSESSFGSFNFEGEKESFESEKGKGKEKNSQDFSTNNLPRKAEQEGLLQEEPFEDFSAENIKQLVGELKTKIKKEEKKNLKNEVIVDKEFLVSLIDVYFILKNTALKSKEINLLKPEVLEKMKNLEGGFEMNKETFFSVLKNRLENLNPLIKEVFDLFQNNKNTPKTSAELLELLGDKIFLLQPKNKINPIELGKLLSKVKKLFEYNSKTRKWKLIDDYYESGRL